MKLFSTSDIEIIRCQDYISVTPARRSNKFLDKLKLCENCYKNVLHL